TSCRRTPSSSTTPVKTPTPRRRCCRSRTASPWAAARRGSDLPSPCSRSPSGTARSLSGITSELFVQAARSGLLLGGVYGLVACGLSLIFGVLRIINFAHGAVMMLGMYATYWLFTLGGIDPYVAIVIVGPLFFLVGMFIQRVVIEPNRFAAEHNQLLLTLGLALFLENLALVLWQGDFRTLRVPYASASIFIADTLVEVPRLIAAGGAVVIAVALYGFLRGTVLGKAIRALAEEREGAWLVGITWGGFRAVPSG